MARPKKIGLDYFPFDVDLFDDPKVLPVSVEFGAIGESILTRLLCAIYREGYCAQWTDGLKFKIANQAKVNEDVVTNVVIKLVKYHFFNEEMFTQHKILTSSGVQKRWKEATRKRVKLSDKIYWLLDKNEVSDGSKAEKTKFPAEETPITQPESTQKKVKEKKVKEEPPIPPQGDESNSEISWKKDFKVYLQELREAFNAIKEDLEWIEKQESFNPGVNIVKSIEKACVNYWATEGGWKKKKRARSINIDWKSTFGNAVSQSMNKVYKPREAELETSSKETVRPEKW